MPRDVLIELWISLIALIGAFAWLIRYNGKITADNARTRTLAEANEVNAQADVVSSRAYQDKAISDLALTMNKNQNATFEHIVELQRQIVETNRELTKAREELATTKAKLEAANQRNEEIYQELTEYKTRYNELFNRVLRIENQQDKVA